MTLAQQRQSLEQALNTAGGAIPLPQDAMGDSGKSKALQTVMRFKAGNADGKLQKALPIMKRAVRKINEGSYREGAQLGLAALDIDENIALANHITAIALDKLGQQPLRLNFTSARTGSIRTSLKFIRIWACLPGAWNCMTRLKNCSAFSAA